MRQMEDFISHCCCLLRHNQQVADFLGQRVSDTEKSAVLNDASALLLVSAGIKFTLLTAGHCQETPFEDFLLKESRQHSRLTGRSSSLLPPPNSPSPSLFFTHFFFFLYPLSTPPLSTSLTQFKSRSTHPKLSSCLPKWLHRASISLMEIQ